MALTSFQMETISGLADAIESPEMPSPRYIADYVCLLFNNEDARCAEVIFDKTFELVDAHKAEVNRG